MISRDTPEGEYRYTYDAAGRLATVTGGGSNLSYERDTLDRILAETVDGRTTRYAYDAVGRRIRRVTASGAESTWTYDAAGRPVGLDTGAGRLDFALDAAGQEIERLVSGGAGLFRSYDIAGRQLTERLTAAPEISTPGAGRVNTILTRSWSWRADGVPEEIQDSLRGERRVVSDRAGRVTAVSARDWSESYTYDDFGNVLTGAETDALSTAAGLVSASVGELTVIDGTLLRQAGRTHHEYDEAGRLVRTVRRTLDGRRKTWTYTWDSQDQLVRAETPDHGTWLYSYDPIGRRTAKSRLTEDGPADELLFSWDGPCLVEQRTGLGGGTVQTLTWDYGPDTFRPLAQRRRTWVDEAGQDAIDEAFHAVITDLVGTPTELVTHHGRVAWHTASTLWGRTVATSVEEGLDCPLRFPGQYHDAETGLHYNLYRYYNPETAAYLTPDPLGLAPSPNDHSYVGNPLTAIDPLGLYELPEGGSDSWDRGTFDSPDESFDYHYKKHGKPLGKTPDEYFQDAKAWRDRMAQPGAKPNYKQSIQHFDEGPGVKYTSTATDPAGQQGGILSPAPLKKVVSFWYNNDV